MMLPMMRMPLSAETRAALRLARLAQARRLTDALLERARGAALYERPIPQRHRPIFYLGHLDAFDWNLLAARLELRREHPFDARFAFGIDPLDGGAPSDVPADWPSAGEIDRYVAGTRRELDAHLPRALAAPSREEEAAPLAFVLDAAVEHRLMHAETLAYLLDRSSAARAYRRRPATRTIGPEFVTIPAGRAVLGRARDGWRSFGWDNEYGTHEVAVAAFEISRCMVDNGRFLRFVQAGGYQAPELWSEPDWRWRRAQELSHPSGWECRDGRWFLRRGAHAVPLPLEWPVHVSHAEASAYARWAGAALPTEAQWQRAAYGTPDATERAYPWGDAPPTARHGNFDFHDEQPHAVDAHADGASAFGVLGLLGNGWEWTSTPFSPLPGFEPFAFYPGYSADFFDGRHYVLKGGGPCTAAALLRRSFRNWFQPHYPYLHAGFRCVRNR